MQNTANGANMPPPERPNLAGKSWYYGAITRNQCDTVLNQHGHDGDYLIRDSETNVSKIIANVNDIQFGYNCVILGLIQ